MTKPTGCPVPREASDSGPSLDRTERILRWLGFKPYGSYADGERPDQWWRGEREFVTLSAHVSPSLDYLVLEKVRTLDGAKQATFAMMIKHVWYARDQVTHWRIAYLPGDYAEAARFLWETP